MNRVLSVKDCLVSVSDEGEAQYLSSVVERYDLWLRCIEYIVVINVRFYIIYIYIYIYIYISYITDIEALMLSTFDGSWLRVSVIYDSVLTKM